MDGDGTPDTSVARASNTTLILLAAVMAIIIFSGIIAAYPNGLHLTPSHALTYQGNNETFFSGELHIMGVVNDTCTAHHVTNLSISSVDEVRIVDTFNEEHVFTNTTLVASTGDCIINGNGVINTTLSPALAAYGTTNTTRLLVLTEDTVTLYYHSTVTITVQNGEITVGNQTWYGNGTVFLTISPNASIHLVAQEFLFSTDVELTLDFDAAPTFNDLFLDQYNISLPPLPFSLNGILGILAHAPTNSQETRETSNIIILRGSGTAHIGKQISVDASGPLVIKDGRFVTDEDASYIWFIPDRIIGLWPVAIAAWLISVFMRKKWTTRFEDHDRHLTGVALIIRVLLLGVAAYLWDREIQYMFGKSIFSALLSLIQGGETGLQAWIVAPFELIPYLAALVFIGLPVRFILSAALGFIGIKRLGDEIGKGTGALLAFLVGAAYIAFYLNVTFAPIVKSFLG